MIGEYLLLEFFRVTNSKTVTTEYGKQNIFGTESKAQVVDAGSYSEQSELLNGRLAMIGFLAAVGPYVLTGQIVPGIF
tara:strand:- start:5383 stop:5616 length:234 start_codon:yes stop_codon:yes gene_type:complete